MQRTIRWGRVVPALLSLAVLPVIALLATEPAPVVQPAAAPPPGPWDAVDVDLSDPTTWRQMFEIAGTVQQGLDADPAAALETGLGLWLEGARLQRQGGLFEAMAGAGLALQASQLVRDALAHPDLDPGALTPLRPRLRALSQDRLDLAALGTRELAEAKRRLRRHALDAPFMAAADYLGARVGVGAAGAVAALGTQPSELVPVHRERSRRSYYAEAALDDRQLRMRAASLYAVVDARLRSEGPGCAEVADWIGLLDASNATWDAARCGLAANDHPEGPPFLVAVAPR